MLTSTPSSVVEAAFQAEDNGDWGAFVALVHPDALEHFRQAQLTALEGLPSTDRFYRRVFQVPDRTAFEQLPPREALRRWGIAAHQPGDRTFKEFREPRRHRRIIGELMEGESLAHVLFRVWYDPGVLDGTPLIRPDQVRLVTTQLDGSMWRVMLNGGLFFSEDGQWGIGLPRNDAPQAPVAPA